MHILEFNIKIDTLCKLFGTNFLHKLNYLSQDEKAKKVIKVRSCGHQSSHQTEKVVCTSPLTFLRKGWIRSSGSLKTLTIRFQMGPIWRAGDFH